MKKLFFLLLLLGSSIFIPEIIRGEDVTGISIPEGAGFGTIAQVVVLTLFITQFLKELFKTKGFATQLVSWLTGALVSGVGWYFQIGIFIEATWQTFTIYVVEISLIANGVQNVPWIKSVLVFLFEFFKKKKAVEKKE